MVIGYLVVALEIDFYTLGFSFIPGMIVAAWSTSSLGRQTWKGIATTL